MTIQKRNKRTRGKGATLPQSPKSKEVALPPMDKMVVNYPRTCPFCSAQSYSARCRCGRMTLITKGG